MAVVGGSPAQPPLNQVTLFAKSTDKRVYVKDDTGAEAKLVTNETVLESLTGQGSLTVSTGLNPTISIAEATTIAAGSMPAADKLKLDSATNLATGNQLVLRDNLGNASFNEVTANTFSGVATSVATVPALSGDVTTTGGTNVTTIGAGVIDNANISGSAAITMDKLVVDPTIRSNHSGDQLASTISNFDSAIDAHLTATAPIVNAMIDGAAAIGMDKLALDPTVRSNHTGDQLASTISNFDSAVDARVGVYLTGNPITNDEVDAAANIAFTKLEDDPRDRSIHTGTQLASTISDFATAAQAAITDGNGIDVTAGVVSAVGTTNRITVAGGTIDIDSGYIGQSSITTVGTVGTGTWNADPINVAYGGTGAGNAGEAANNLIAVLSIAGSPTLDETHGVVIVDSDAGNRTVTLPDASSVYRYTIIKSAAANNVDINVQVGDTFEDGASTSKTLTTLGESATIVSDGTSTWWTVATT